MITAVLLIWGSLIASAYMIYREFRKKETAFIFRIEQLEREVLEMKNNEPLNAAARKINAMACELVEVIQKKEDDIKALLSDVEERKTERKNVNVKTFRKVASDPEMGALSQSEQHTLEMLRKRRVK